MPKVRCHDVSDVIVHDGDYRPILMKFDRRALLDAGPDDIVILPREMRVPEEAELHHRLIGGTAPSNVRTSFRGMEGAELEPFSGTASWLRRRASRHRMQIQAPTLEACWRANDKGVFQKLCGGDPEAHLLPGSVCRPGQLTAAVKMMHDNCGLPVRVKATRSASGFFQETVMPGAKPVMNGHRGGPTAYVVQPEAFWGRDKSQVLEVSVQYEIFEDGSFRVGPVTGNMTRDSKHFGNYFPVHAPPPGFQALPRELEAELIAATIRMIILYPAKLGYWGFGSLDFIVDIVTGEYYALDPNDRYGGPRYPINLLMRLFGEVRPFDLRSMTVPKGMTLAELEEHFAPIVFDWQTGRGFIPFVFLPQFGYCNTVICANDPDERNWYLGRADQLKQQLAV